jgi:hypothetical protein
MEECAPKRKMFPDSGIDGLAKMAPIRKVIPYDIIANIQGNQSKWQYSPNATDTDQNPKPQPMYVYKPHPLNPDEIFNEGTNQLYRCLNSEPYQGTERKYKIQNLQYSKYYAGGYYNSKSPDYVNSQLFFRAIPGDWGFVKWGSTCLNASDCKYCQGPTPCSPFNIYGIGAEVTGNPENMWHSPDILMAYYPYADGQEPRYNGIEAICNGINPSSDPDTCPGNGVSNRGEGGNGQYPCGHGGLAWDPSGAPSVVVCTPYCGNSTACDNGNYPCGSQCAARCWNFAVSANNGDPNNLTASCQSLYGKDCCECLGVDPNSYISEKDWASLLFSQNGKCGECGIKCRVGCPSSPIDVNNTISYYVDVGAGTNGGGWSWRY